MDWSHWLGLLVAVSLAMYLSAALLVPENFS
jgi:K+-transporting ATPase KdpF subunit